MTVDTSTAVDARPRFRPDVQALRAVGVSLVVLYHLWPTYLPGGFVGVDVFFVISGYLITSHLVREVLATATVRPLRFWARRVRRLLPASLTVLLASVIAVYLVLPESVRTKNLSEIVASTLYAENWYLGATDIDYLRATSPPSIVQHFWSLGVEEQFYAVWPLLLIAALALIRLRRTRAVAIALGLVFVASFAASVIVTPLDQSFAYFATHTRAWEFALGGLVALAPLHRLPFRSIAGWIGLAAIAVAALLFNDDSAFPGWIALLPVVGTALVIAAEGRWGLGRIAAWRPIQVVGDLSYSIYLWHWPLIVAVGALLPLGAVAKAAILVAAVVLAALTKRFVEDPFRARSYRVLRGRRVYVAVGVASLLVLGLAGGGLGAIQASYARIASLEQQAASGVRSCFGGPAGDIANNCPHPFDSAPEIAIDLAPSDYNQSCLTGVVDDHVTACVSGDTTSPRATIALIGDSHGETWAEPLALYGAAHGIRVIQYTKGGCSGATRDLLSLQDSRYPLMAESCQRWSNAVYDAVVADDSIDLVVLSNRTRGYIRADLAVPLTAVQVEASFAEFEAAGKTVVVIRDVPGTLDDGNAPQCLLEHAPDYTACAVPQDAVQRADPLRDAALKTTESVVFIDLSDLFCRDGACYSFVGGVTAYRDDGHLTRTFARTLTSYVAGPIDAALHGS